jgi:hypothetical protein
MTTRPASDPSNITRPSGPHQGRILAVDLDGEADGDPSSKNLLFFFADQQKADLRAL